VASKFSSNTLLPWLGKAAVLLQINSDVIICIPDTCVKALHLCVEVIIIIIWGGGGWGKGKKNPGFLYQASEGIFRRMLKILV
jgi:hypothetical protein